LQPAEDNGNSVIISDLNEFRAVRKNSQPFMFMASRKRLTITGIFLFCAMLEVVVCWLYQGSATTGHSLFSADEARALHRQIFPQHPHVTGSTENAAVRAAIVRRLRQQGWTVEETPAGSGPDEGSGNIVAFRKELQELNTTPLVLASHFDSCATGPGAADAGGCVAAIMEAARLLTQNPAALKRPVWLLFTDGEEQGLLGAKEFVRSHPLSRQQPFVLNFDARGTSGPVVMFETHDGSYSAIHRWASHFPVPRLTGSLFTTVYRSLPNGTDFTEFRQAGWHGFNFAIIDGAHRYHQPTDTLENLDNRSLQHFGDTALSVGRAIAESDEDLSAPSSDAIFFDVLGQYVVSVPASWNVPIRIALLFIAVRIYGRPLLRDKRYREVIRVWGTMAILLPLMTGLGWAFSQSIYGSSLLPKAFVAHGHWLTLLEWIVSLSVSCGLMHGMLRRVDCHTVWSAFWLAHAATCLVVSYFIPEFSYLLSVPAMFAIVATLLIRSHLIRTAVVTCLCAVLLIPLHHLLAIGLGPANGMLLFPAFSLLAMPLLPAFARYPSGLLTESAAGQ